jgi:hypothetical protein
MVNIQFNRKSEILVLGSNAEEQPRIVNLLNCQVGDSDRHIGKLQIKWEINYNIGKRKSMTSGG